MAVEGFMDFLFERVEEGLRVEPDVVGCVHVQDPKFGRRCVLCCVCNTSPGEGGGEFYVALQRAAYEVEINGRESRFLTPALYGWYCRLGWMHTLCPAFL